MRYPRSTPTGEHQVGDVTQIKETKKEKQRKTTKRKRT